MFPQYSDYPSFNEVYQQIKPKLFPLETKRAKALARRKLNTFFLIISIGTIAFGFIYFIAISENFKVLFPCIIFGVMLLVITGASIYNLMLRTGIPIL